MEWMKVKMMADRQRAEIRAEMEARTGIYLTRSDGETSEDEDEEDQHQGKDEGEIHNVRMVILHGDKGAHGGQAEEAAESEPKEDDAEVEIGDDGYEAEGDWDGGCGAEHLPDAVSEDMELVEIVVEEDPEEEISGHCM